MRSTVSLRHLAGIATAIVLAGTRLEAQASPGESPPPLHTGAWIVGGSGSLDHVANQTDFSVTPSALGFVNSRFAVGGEAVVTANSTTGGTSHVWGIGPTARLFLADPSDHVLPFISASALPEWSDQGLLKERVITLDGSFGATYLLSTRAGLTGEIYATHFNFNVTSAQGGLTATNGSATHYGVRFGFTVFVH